MKAFVLLGVIDALILRLLDAHKIVQVIQKEKKEFCSVEASTCSVICAQSNLQSGNILS